MAKTSPRKIGGPTIPCSSTASRCRPISAIRSARHRGSDVLLRDVSGQGRKRPNVTIELLQNGKPVAQLPMPVPPADANGRIQQLGRLPIDQLVPAPMSCEPSRSRRPTDSPFDDATHRRVRADAAMPIRRAAIVAALLLAGSGTATVRSRPPGREGRPASTPRRRPPSWSTSSSAIAGASRHGPRRGFRGLRGRRQSEGRYVHPRVARRRNRSRGGVEGRSTTTSVMTSRPVPESAATPPD